MIAYYETFGTPVGLLSLAVNEKGAVIATAFGDLTTLRTRCRATEYIEQPKRTFLAHQQVMAYFDGDLRVFTLPLDPVGTPYQLSVWKALSRIPFGETRSYGEIAAQLGSGPRAVGSANRVNPIALIVPCHRVIGADGALTGFAFGTEIKRKLIRHENTTDDCQIVGMQWEGNYQPQSKNAYSFK